ncbi:MAG TPA: NAD-dependent succinate-semialdehyde dehydrogenase [Thermodesulfobacteriota bacterium]|nr:NAD-dependent succinate-semialdehyde dehydrogenase [Thermodesulfobacteriota bacterium]
MGIASINPATGEVIKIFTHLTDREVEHKLALAQKAFEQYKNIPISQRAEWMNEAAQILESNSRQFGKLITLEMGKTFVSAAGEVEKCAFNCRFYAERAAEFLGDVPVATDAGRSFIRFQPLGAVLAVMPWNFPFWQVFRFAAPALMAGNVILLKHASNVPQSALTIEEIFRDAGFPEGVFQTLLITAEKVKDALEDERVKAATLTGSESAGANLASIAGKNIKKTVLELGGSDPFIVFETADLDEAVSAAVTARIMNNGQSCIAAKRLIAVGAIGEKFEQRLVEKFKKLKIGNPMEADTDLGPLATPDILKTLDLQVQACVQKGANVLTGGQPLSDCPGNFYLPTILTDIPPGTPADHEEFFGPVALLYRVKDIDEAIRLANGTHFGLGASVWTKNNSEIEKLVNELESGAVFVNGMVKSDPRLPFGGIKRSGYGKELGIQGIHEFVNIKTVWVK